MFSSRFYSNTVRMLKGVELQVVVVVVGGVVLEAQSLAAEEEMD